MCIVVLSKHIADPWPDPIAPISRLPCHLVRERVWVSSTKSLACSNDQTLKSFTEHLRRRSRHPHPPPHLSLHRAPAVCSWHQLEWWQQNSPC